MSNITFTTNQFETQSPLPHRGMQLGLIPESHYGNLSLSPSPDSSSSVSIQSDREASSSPDINMRECSPSEVDNHRTILIQGNLFCDGSMNLNETFIATPLNGSVNFWNESLSLKNNQEPSSVENQTSSHDDSGSLVTSPDSGGRRSQLTSSETSRRGSTENECCSVSSGEMVMRSNSFCLADQSLLVVSSLDESSPGHPKLPSELDLLSPNLLNAYEKSTERLLDENAGNPHLGQTFNFPTELPTQENDMNAANGFSYLSMPSENEGDLLMTFAYENSSDCGKEVNFATAGVDIVPNFHGEFTPEQGSAFVTTLSAIQDTDKDIQTSTPVQNFGNKIPSLPSLSESPCTGNTGSAGPCSTKGMHISGSPKQALVAGMLSSDSKVKKVEIKKFPKSDFSNVKSKVVTRHHQIVVQGPATQHKASQVNVHGKHTQSLNGATSRMSPAKVRSITAVVSANRDSDPQRRASTGAANSAVSSSYTAGNGQCKSGTSTAGNKHALAVPRSSASSEKEQVDSSQVAESTSQHTGNQTFCLTSFEKSPDRSGQKDPKPTPKKGVSNKIEVRPGSALGQGKTPLFKTRPRCSSELSSSSRPPREKKPTVRFPTSLTTHKPDIHLGKTKVGNLNGFSQSKSAIQPSEGPAENSPREVKKISLVTDSSKEAGAILDDNGRSRGRPSPRRARPATLVQPSMPSTLSARQRQETYSKNEVRTPKAIGTPQLKQKSNAGSQVATVEPSLGPASAASIKPQLNGSRPPQGPSHPSSMGPPPIPTTRLLRKTSGLSRSQTEDSELSEGGPAQKTASFKTAALKTRLTSTPGKNSGSTFSTSCKSTASTIKGSSNSVGNPLRRTGSSRFVRLTSSGLAKGLLRNIQLLSGCRKNTVVFQAVDKNKAKAGSRQQQPQPQASQLNQTNGPPDVVPAGVAKSDGKNQGIHQLKGLLTASNCRFEAVAIVLQQILNERDEATRQCRELSQELVSLRGELVSSVHSSERLEKEKEELRVSLENALQRLQEQHQKDLEEVEQRLQAFYQAEWDKVHLNYQAEADKCKTLMEQQMGELKAEHEAKKLELETSHIEQLQRVKQQYETSLEELRKIHSQELESLDKTLKDAEAALSGQIQELTEENSVLIEKLATEENKRRELAEKSQKDSHTVYLEQELESLKVVVDIKNKQLHQQEKKLMEIDKLTEKNVKLDESLNKVQQENEDLKARMERHAALSRQLSTEQAMLHESLQKESKVNKRLSMENEELLWKLHNGDLSSPHKVSPTSTSPSHSFSLQSPRNSSVFSSQPSSPR